MGPYQPNPGRRNMMTYLVWLDWYKVGQCHEAPYDRLTAEIVDAMIAGSSIKYDRETRWAMKIRWEGR